MNKLARNLWICMLAATAVACGGGGGDSGPAQNVNDPDAIAARIQVSDPGAQVVTGSPPKSTATPQAPVVTSTENALQTASSGDTVDIDLGIESTDGVSALLARISAANQFIQIADPDVTEDQGASAKALAGAVAFTGKITLQIGADLQADQFCFEIAAIDESGRVSNYRKICFDLPGNRSGSLKPQVNAGGDQTVSQGDVVTLNGSSNEAQGSFSWTQTSGPAVTLTGDGAQASFTAPDVSGLQDLKFQLTFTTDDGQTAKDSTTVSVIDTDQNSPPSVDAGAAQSVDEGATVNLRGLATDSDGSVSVAWTSSDANVQLSTPSRQRTSFVAPARTQENDGSTITFTLTATDDDGASTSDTVVITVNNLNQVPVAGNAALSVIKNQFVEGFLTEFVSDADGEELSYELVSNVSDGTLILDGDGYYRYTPNTDFTGNDSFSYRVSDGADNSEPASVSITVLDQIGTSGGAGKGVIGGATINAEEIGASGTTSRGTATTASDGNYDLVLAGYEGGPLLLSLNGGDGVTMKCDLSGGCNGVAFGEPVPLPAGFQMQTLLPAVASSADLASCISPFTHLAAQRAIEVAGSLQAVTAVIAREALSEVGSLLGGIDVLRTCVVDTTVLAEQRAASSKELSLSVLSAAVLAVQGGTDPTVALSSLVSQFAGGVISGPNLQALVNAASTELNALSEDDRAGVLAAMQQAASTAGDGNFDPQPNAAAGSSDVEQGKALIAGVRNLGRSLFNDAEGYDETDSSHPANIFYNRIVAANDEVLLDAVNAGLVRAYDEADAFYNRNPDQPGEPGQTTIQSQDSGGVARTATITISNAAGGIHTVTVVGQVGDAVIDWRVTTPTQAGTEGNRPSGNLFGDFVATVRTADGVTPGYTLTADGSITLESLSISSRTVTIPVIPSASISIDGNADDWSAVTQFADPAGDQNGNSATDITGFAIATDSTAGTANLLMVTDGAVAFPHTGGQSTSHYETGVHVFWDKNCESEAGFYIANNFTDTQGNVTHQLDDYVFFGQSQPTNYSSGGNVLETSFNLNVLGQFESILLNPYTQSFGSTGRSEHDDVDDDTSDGSCFNLNEAGTRVDEFYQDGDVQFELSFDFRQTGVTNPLIMAGILDLALVNCGDCAEDTEANNALNLGHFTVAAELFDESGNNGGGFLFDVNFDQIAEVIFDFREDVSPGNVPAASFTLAFDATLDGTPYELVLAGDFKDIIRTVPDPDGTGDFTEVDAELTVRIARDGRFMALVAQAPTIENDVVVFKASIENQDGVELRFEVPDTLDGPISGEVFVGTTKVGELEETDSGLILIRWIDGSFESLG